MKQPMTVADILNSVEFELMQHTLLQDDVADGIQRLRVYQTQARSELLGDGKKPSISSAIDVQFNTNAMVLTLLQVINQRLEALQQDFRHALIAQQHSPSASDTDRSESAQIEDIQSGQQWRNIAAASVSWPVAQGAVDFAEGALSADAISEFITDEPTLIEMDVRQSHTPLLGGMLNRVRRELHELVLFYVNKMVRQQADVNRAYGSLLQELVAANQAQAWEIHELRTQLHQLTGQQSTGAPHSHSNIPPEP